MHKFWRSVTVVLAAIALISLWGCSNQPVAIVNGTRITKKEFYDRLEQAGGTKVLQELIARRLLTDAFDKSGLKLTDQELNDELAQIKKQVPDEAAWAQYLKQQGITEAEVKDMIAFNLKVKKLAEKDLKPTAADLRDEFTHYRNDFNRPAAVTLSEIVVSDKTKADEIRKQLNDPKASFATLARQYSISTYTRERGGRRPEEAAEAVMPEALRPSVANLQVGQISQPIKADQAWYIIKLEAKTAAETPSFDKIQDKVTQHYMYTHAKSPQELLEELRKTAKVNVTDPKYADLNKVFGPPASLPSFGDQKGGTSPATPATGQ